MSLLRQNHTTVAERPSVQVVLNLIRKDGQPLDASEAWASLLDAFKHNPNFAVKSAEIKPDKS